MFVLADSDLVVLEFLILAWRKGKFGAGKSGDFISEVRHHNCIIGGRSKAIALSGP